VIATRRGNAVKKHVLVVGSIAFDDLEMPTGSFPNVLGGAATYSSLAASLLAPARVVGVVGSDFDEAHLVMLREHGVDTAGVERAAGKTFRWRGRYAPDLMRRSTRSSTSSPTSARRSRRPTSPRRTSSSGTSTRACSSTSSSRWTSRSSSRPTR
jgi:sugar/nucleoside kinase (ribokinase family)